MCFIEKENPRSCIAFSYHVYRFPSSERGSEFSFIFHYTDVFDKNRPVILYNVLLSGFAVSMWLDSGYALLARTPQEWCWILLSASYQEEHAVE